MAGANSSGQPMGMAPSSTRPILSRLDKTADRIQFQSHTLWLFTYSDLKTMIISSTIFSVTNALAANCYGIVTPVILAHGISDNNSSHHLTIHHLKHALLILLKVYLNFLPFVISNQLDAESIAEDTLNKPWRPLPRRR